MSTRRYARRDEVSATELAEMGFCEKRVQLAHLYGDQVTAAQRKAMARGQVAHQRYLEEGSGSNGGSPVLCDHLRVRPGCAGDAGASRIP